MREKIKDKLDQEIKRSKRKRIFTPLLIGAAFLGFIGILLPFFPSSSTNIQGIAIKLTAVQTDEGNFPKMLIRLENNATVRASMPRNLEFIKGAKVNVLKTKSITNIYSYKVLGYVKPST